MTKSKFNLRKKLKIAAVMLLMTAALSVCAWGRNLYLFDSAQSAAAEISEDAPFTLFFAASAAISAPVPEDALILAFSSKLTVLGDFNGKLYSFFGEIKIEGDAAENSVFVDFSPPVWLVWAAFSALKAAFCVILYSLKKPFVEQCAAALVKTPVLAVSYGAGLFALVVACVCVFAMTVVFAPVGAAVFAVFYVAAAFGEAAVGAALWGLVCRKIPKFKSDNPYRRASAGLAAVAVLKAAPYAGFVLSLVILPIFAGGAVVVGLLNRYCVKVFYEVQ